MDLKDKEAVRMMEPHACVQKGEDGAWLVRKHPEGRILGAGRDGAGAWRAARLNLFGENVSAILSEIPVKK